MASHRIQAERSVDWSSGGVHLRRASEMLFGCSVEGNARVWSAVHLHPSEFSVAPRCIQASPPRLPAKLNVILRDYCLTLGQGTRSFILGAPAAVDICYIKRWWCPGSRPGSKPPILHLDSHIPARTDADISKRPDPSAFLPLYCDLATPAPITVNRVHQNLQV